MPQIYHSIICPNKLIIPFLAKLEAVFQQLSFRFCKAFLLKNIVLTVALEANVTSVIAFQLRLSFVEADRNPSIGKFNHYGGIRIGEDPDSPLLDKGILWLIEISLSLISTAIKAPIFLTSSSVSSPVVIGTPLISRHSRRVY